MNSNLLVSFIIPCYNLPEGMLRKCVESILALDLKPEEREIIVVDDGSDVSPLPGLGSLKELVVYVRQENGGLSRARNTGIERAKGVYLQFVDGDDWLLTKSYNHCLELARREEADMILFDFTSQETAQETFSDGEPMSGCDYMSRHNLRATACGYLFKREALGTLRFTSGIYHEDEEFTPQLLLSIGVLQPTSAQAYFYRQRSDSITTATQLRKRLKRLGDTRSVLLRLKALTATLPTEKRTALERRVAQLTMDYLYQTIMETHSCRYLQRQTETLRKEGLFPLPDRNYTVKYRWFSRITRCRAGRCLLVLLLPFTQRER